MKKGFTLAEVMVVLIVLGIIASVTIPQVVKRHIEASNRAKIKKAMAVYDTAINKMVVENDIKSQVALQNFAGEKCENSVTYFKVNENLNEQNSCEFKAADGVFWNITDVLNPVISLDDEYRNNLDNSKTFQLSAKFDENGSLRVSDLQYEKMIADEENIENLEKVYGFIAGKEEGEDENLSDFMKTCEIVDGSEYRCDGTNYQEVHISEMTVKYCWTVGFGERCAESTTSSTDIIVSETIEESVPPGAWANAYCKDKNARAATLAELKALYVVNDLKCADGSTNCIIWAKEPHPNFDGEITSDNAFAFDVSTGKVVSKSGLDQDGQVVCVGE